MLQYILECIAFQLVFLIIYDLFLKRETFFQWNRAYLIGTYLISMVLPWIKIEAMKSTVPESFQAYPEFLWNINDAAAVATAPAETTFNISWEYTLLFSGMFIATLFFGYKLFQIYALKRKGEVQYFKDFTRIIVANSSMAFSFFKSIFLGDKVIEREHQNILQHELVHIQQRHSYDLIFFELMRIVGWFNPLVYVYQSRVSELHEYIADSQIAKTNKKEQYQLLLSEVFQTQNISFINQFFKTSLIKKRIVMLQKTKSKKISQLKYLLLLPLVFGMLAYTSFETSINDNIEHDQTTEDRKLIDEVKAEIEEEVVKMGTLTKVFFAFVRSFDNQGETYVFTKREYFKEQLLYKMHFAELKPVEFGDDVKSKNPLPEMNLPSAIRYESYVNREKAFQILDENLMISVNRNQLAIRKVEKEDKNLGPGDFVSVVNLSDFTGDEIRNINRKIEQIDFTNRFLFISDNEHAFLITRAQENVDKNQLKSTTNSESEFIEVGDVENLSKKEERKIFKRLNVLSQTSENWMLIVKDDKTRMQFVPANDGSYLSGPNGEKIASKLIYDSELNAADTLSIQEFIKKNGTANFQELEDITFTEVDQVPIFPGCENEDNKRACFLKAMQKHIGMNFRYPKEAQEKGIQGRVSIMFKMDTEGSITNVRMRGPDKLLEDEAARIIGLLPRVKPGIHNGKKVNVLFSIPITFKLNSYGPDYQILPEIGTSDKNLLSSIRQYNQLVNERNRLLKSKNEKNPIIVNLDQQLEALKKSLRNQMSSETNTSKTGEIDYDNKVDVPFAVVDEVPIFPGCEDESNRRECFNKMMQKHISTNFRYPEEAQLKGIQGRVSIMLTIDEEGKVSNIRKRGPDKLLEGEAERIMNLLPIMTPGKQRGKAVRVPYSIPITFKLQGDSDKIEDLKLSDITGSDPLLIIDGVQSLNTTINDLDANNIKSIMVFKDEAATKEYGEKGKNGVIVITTKKKD